VHTGRVYQVLGDRERAQQAFRRAIAVLSRLAHDFPDDPVYAREHATAIDILAGDLYHAGRIREGNAYYSQAIRAFRAAFRDHPADAETATKLAWSLCLCPALDLRDPTGAVTPARKAVELAPHLPVSWLVLGVACYRTGRWHAAAKALQQGLRTSGDETGFDRTITSLFLAMAHWRCGRREQAKNAYERAIRRMKNNPRGCDNLDRAIRAEASALLGMRELPPPKPKEEARRKH
jgi:tetratricopeptide (TPR) repeat protein